MTGSSTCSATERCTPHASTDLRSPASASRAELARALADHHDTNGAGPHLTGCDDILAASEDRSGQEGTVELARAALAAAGKRHHDADEAHARAAHVLATYRLPWKQAEALDAWAAWLTSGAAGAEDA